MKILVDKHSDADFTVIDAVTEPEELPWGPSCFVPFVGRLTRKQVHESESMRSLGSIALGDIFAPSTSIIGLLMRDLIVLIEDVRPS